MSTEAFKYPKSGRHYNLTRRLTGEALDRIFNIQTVGEDNLESIGPNNPAIFAFFPHTGHGDSLIINHQILKAGVPELVLPAAENTWFRDRTHELIANHVAKTYPMPRDVGIGALKETLKAFSHFLRIGHSLLVSIEGTRSLKPVEERELKDGCYFIASNLGVPIVPVVIAGYETVYPKGTRLPKLLTADNHRRTIHVLFDQPINVPPVNGRSSAQAKREFMDCLKQRYVERYNYLKTYRSTY